MTYSNEDLARIAQQHGAKLIAVTGPDIADDVTTLRRAASQARAEGQETDAPCRAVIFTFASMLTNEADKVEGGDRSTLPPVLASARAWIDGAPGTQAIEDANNYLDEQVRGAVDAR